jgi:hypothetical protein
LNDLLELFLSYQAFRDLLYPMNVGMISQYTNLISKQTSFIQYLKIQLDIKHKFFEATIEFVPRIPELFVYVVITPEVKE